MTTHVNSQLGDESQQDGAEQSQDPPQVEVCFPVEPQLVQLDALRFQHVVDRHLVLEPLRVSSFSSVFESLELGQAFTQGQDSSGLQELDC